MLEIGELYYLNEESFKKRHVRAHLLDLSKTHLTMGEAIMFFEEDALFLYVGNWKDIDSVNSSNISSRPVFLYENALYLGFKNVDDYIKLVQKE